MTNVIPFPHAPIQPIGHFIRLGETGHHKLSNLHAAGRLPISRAVVDASRFKHQKELIGALRTKGVEIILDTKIAELSALEKFNGYPKHAPWAAVGDGRPLMPQHFAPQAAVNIFGQIARFVVENNIDAVLAPTHFVGDPNFKNWFEIDRASCLALRYSLDKEGGSEVAIDYPLIAPHTMLIDDTSRSVLMSGLADLPFDNLWIRASGYGHDAPPLTTRRFIVSMTAMHNLGKPIIGDYLGGLVGHAALAFGALSGLAHGIGERERFDARSWHKPAKKSEEGSSGGRARRVLVAGLDRSATIAELELMAAARGGHKLVACNDRTCCPHGLKDMIGDPRQHAAHQSHAIIAEMASTPDLKREHHFLNGRMSDVERQSREAKELKFSTEEGAKRKIDIVNFSERIANHSTKMSKMKQTLEDLCDTRADASPRARAIAVRRKAGRQSKTITK